MKQLLFVLIVPLGLCAQSKNVDQEILHIRENAVRVSTDSACRVLLDEFYESFESDLGLANPKMLSAYARLSDYSSNPAVPNHHVAVLLAEYVNSIASPEEALKWIRALTEETKLLWGERHPLTYLYEGESLMNARKGSEARAVFSEMHDELKGSAVAMFYIYKLESDNRLRGTWLSVLKSLYPNHWLVKTIK